MYAENAEGQAVDLIITNGTALKIGNEEVLTDSDYADLIAQLGTEIANRANADTLLTTSINAIETQYQVADTTIRSEIAAADTAVRNEFAAADAALALELTNAVSRLDVRIDEETAARIAADQALQSNVDAIALDAQAIAENTTKIENNRQMIEENRKGIAMVAALTHSTVLPGKSHALDISAASFEGEMGVAINYSGRLDENTQVNFGYAGTGFFEENIIRGGIGFQW